MATGRTRPAATVRSCHWPPCRCVTVSYHGGDGIELDRCYEDARVNSCLITYNKQTGLNLPGCHDHDTVVSANQFE